MILRRVTRSPLCQALPPLQPVYRSLLPAAPLSAPAVFVGSVDASRERLGRMPRTVAEAFGPGVTSDSVRHPESCDAAATRAHNVATFVSAGVGIVVLITFVAQRVFG